MHSCMYQCTSDPAYGRFLKGIHLLFLWGNSRKLCQKWSDDGLEVSWVPGAAWCDLCCSCCSQNGFSNTKGESPSLAQGDMSMSLKTKSQIWYKRPCNYMMLWENRVKWSMGNSWVQTSQNQQLLQPECPESIAAIFNTSSSGNVFYSLQFSCASFTTWVWSRDSSIIVYL